MQTKQRIRSLYHNLLQNKQSNQNIADAEKDLWQALQKRNLKGYHFTRKVSVPPYFVDFLCVELKLIIALDDGPTQSQRIDDKQKRRFLNSNGYRVIYFLPNEVLHNPMAVVNCLIPTLARRGLELNIPSPYESSDRSQSHG